jgi:predicted nuclease with TOPRIM domain
MIMKTDLKGAEFQSMLAGEKGLAALDVARDLNDILEDNSRLTSEFEKWQKEAEARGDRLSAIIDEKTALEEQHKALKAALAEMAK